MDPISPSWVEHYNKNIPGWITFQNEDNYIQDKNDDFIIITMNNLNKILSLPYGSFASLLAFDEDLIKFYDMFLIHRERMGTNEFVIPMDIAVFSLFYRFVIDFPIKITFTPGSKANSLIDLHVITPQRILLLISLYHQPGSIMFSSPIQDLIKQWILIHPSFERDVCRMLESWSLTKTSLGNKNASGLRGYFEILIGQTNKLFKSISGIRGTIMDSIPIFARWFLNATTISEKSNILACLFFGITHFEFEEMELFSNFLKNFDNDNKIKQVFGTLMKNNNFSTNLQNQCLLLQINESRIKFILGVLESFISESKEDISVNFDETCVLIIEEEQEQQQQEEDNEEETNKSDVDRLKEIAPHLGRYFCEKLLEACNYNLERAIMSVMEGSLPEAVMNIDFSLESAPSSKAILETKAEFKKNDKSANDILNEGVDNDLRTKLKAIYNRYDDEYDDALDGGGKVVVDIGATNLDDPSDDEEQDKEDEEEEEREQEERKQNKTKSLQEQQRKYEPKKKEQSTTTDRNVMLAPVNRQKSYIDVNGERRTAEGVLVEEDVLMRPNLNHTIHAPRTTPRIKSHVEQQRPTTKTEQEMQIEKTRRERERKESKGNGARSQGADKKQSKLGLMQKPS